MDNKGGKDLALGSYHCYDFFPTHWVMCGPDRDSLQPAPELCGRFVCSGILLALEKPC